MRKRLIARAAALALCFVFVGITASGMLAAEKRSAKLDGRLFLQRPVHFLVSIFPGLGSILISQKKIATPSSSVIKPTGDLVIGRPSTGD